MLKLQMKMKVLQTLKTILNSSVFARTVVDYLIVGLGNPGSKYIQTRHNVGFWLIDSIAESKGLNFKHQKSILHAHYSLMSHNNRKFALVKPTTFMNESGHIQKPFCLF